MIFNSTAEKAMYHIYAYIEPIGSDPEAAEEYIKYHWKETDQILRQLVRENEELRMKSQEAERIGKGKNIA